MFPETKSRETSGLLGKQNKLFPSGSDVKGLFTWREEDPSRLNNFTLGLHAEIPFVGNL